MVCCFRFRARYNSYQSWNLSVRQLISLLFDGLDLMWLRLWLLQGKGGGSKSEGVHYTARRREL